MDRCLVEEAVDLPLTALAGVRAAELPLARSPAIVEEDLLEVSIVLGLKVIIK